GSEAGRVVLWRPPDSVAGSTPARGAKSLRERAGFTADRQARDWQPRVSRRTKKAPPASGGWSAFLTSWASVDILDPVATGFLNASCEKAMFGWPCDAELERLRDAFAKETDPAKQRAIAEQVQLREAEYPTHVQLGQYVQPVAMRKNVSGLLTGPSIAFWNIEVK